MIRRIILSVCIGVSVAQAGQFQDPTRPDTYEGAVPSSQQHVLSAIIINHSRRLAMIDGRVVKEGESIGDSRVVSISDNVVQLDTPNGTVNLSLQSVDIKVSADKQTIVNKQGRDHE